MTSISPSLGLIMLSGNSFVGNLLRSPTQVPFVPSANDNNRPPPPLVGAGMHQASLLSRELFFQRDRSEPPAVTRSKSKAAYYLTPIRLGHVVGMSLTHEQWSKKDIEKVLVETGVVPISTPAGRRVNVDGVHTNVSLSRFLRIFHLVRESHLECNDLNLLHLNSNQEVATSPCLLLLLRFLWEKSHSKRCLLDFLDTVHEYRPVLRHGKSSTWDPDDLNTFLTSSIDRKDLEQTNKIEHAALRLLSTTTLREILRKGEGGSSPNENTTSSSWMSSAGRDCELVAASLSSAQAHKPAIKMSRHGFNGGESKPDCVEVVLREMFDLLLFDSTTSRFDSEARLPLTASPAVRDFYKRHSEVHLQDDDGSIEEIRSFEWFQLCSNLPMVDYTASSVSPLVADLSTVSMGLVSRKRGGAAAAKK